MSNTYQIKTALESTETSATLLHTILLEKYGEEVYDWDPLTVALEAQADYGCDPSSESMDRWSAMSVLMTSDAFFKRLDAFLNICAAFSSGSPAFEVFSPPTLQECAWGIAEAALNREFLPFSPAIRGYLRHLLEEAGYEPGDYPDIFTEVFDARPDASVIRDGLGPQENTTGIDRYIDEKLADLVSEFDKIPALKGVERLIRERGLEEAMHEIERK